MTIRVASANDIPKMQRVRESVRENTLPDYSVLSTDRYREHLEDLGRGWVYEREGRVIGIAVANLEDASIWALFVEPKWEGQGIGRALHDVMLAWLRANGATLVSLGTDPGTRAARFYEAAGWTRLGIDSSGEAIYEKSLA